MIGPSLSHSAAQVIGETSSLFYAKLSDRSEQYLEVRIPRIFFVLMTRSFRVSLVKRSESIISPRMALQRKQRAFRRKTMGPPSSGRREDRSLPRWNYLTSVQLKFWKRFTSLMSPPLPPPPPLDAELPTETLLKSQMKRSRPESWTNWRSLSGQCGFDLGLWRALESDF
jgi:hypothetical protein